MSLRLYRITLLMISLSWLMTGMYLSAVLQRIDAGGHARGNDIFLLGTWVLMAGGGVWSLLSVPQHPPRNA
jgi:hypothetical protein